MKNSIRLTAMLLLLLSASLILDARGAGQSPTQQARDASSTLVPDCAAMAIVKEANQHIQERVNSPRAHPLRLPPVPAEAIRANTLLIALVAQHRMDAPGADVARFATLRDTSVKLAKAVATEPNKYDEIKRLADLMNKFPDLPVDRDARHTHLRLKDTYDHVDVALLLTSCGGVRTQRLELKLIQFMRKTAVLDAEQSDQVELLAYKLALIAEFNRELDDFVPKERNRERPEWRKFATEVNEKSWRLAASARRGNPDEIKRDLRLVFDSCSSCHIKFRD